MTRSRNLAFVVAASILALDQWTKVIIRERLGLHESIATIPGFFNIVHAENPGAAFSMLADSSPAVRSVFLIGLAMLVTAILVAALFGKFGIVDSSLSRWAISLILGGASGNLLDRIRVGTVTDFLEFYAGTYYWPAFNVADSAIFCGAVLLFLDHWIVRKRAATPPDEPAVAPESQQHVP